MPHLKLSRYLLIKAINSILGNKHALAEKKLLFLYSKVFIMEFEELDNFSCGTISP